MTWLEENRACLAHAAARFGPRPHAIEPLRLRAWLRSPVYWDGRDPLMLEGALQHVVIRRVTGRMPDDVFAACTREESARICIPVPIADVEIGGVPIAAASCAWPWPISAEGTRHRNKRARLDALGAGRVTISGGAYKSLRIPTSVLHVPSLDFFVLGDRDRIEDLLRDVAGLGRDAARGLGGIEGWEIDPDPLDRAVTFQGRPMRPLPELADGNVYDVRSFEPSSYEARPCTLRAPYWRDWMRVPAVVPVVPVADDASWWADVVREEEGRSG